MVSIPLRQAKNGITSSSNSRNSVLFQFLLGRLKTHRISVIHIDYAMFQFLLGRLKTQNGFIKIMKIISVSIPLRQAKNGGVVRMLEKIKTCFNSS